MIRLAFQNRLSYLLLLVCLGMATSAYAQETDTDDRIAAIVAAAEPTIIQQIESPDGSQRAVVTIYPCVNIGEEEASYERLDLINDRTDETHLIAEQVINCQGVGAFGLWVRTWSANGEFLYYTDAREGVPDGMAGSWVPPLWRVQLADLQVDRLGPAQFSPNGLWIATWSPTQISIMSVDSTDQTDFGSVLTDVQIVEIVWLPDNSGLLYIQAHTPYASSRSVVTHIDLATMEQTLLLDTGR